MKLRHARLEERRKTYEWSLNIVSEDASSGWADGPKHSYAEFVEDFEDFFYMENGRKKGGVLIIEENGEEIGCACYTAFHLKQGAAELDVWMKDEAHCGRGFGSEAIKLLMAYLKNELSINRLFVRQKSENLRAIRAYEKMGFQLVNDASETIVAWLKPEYIEVQGNQGDSHTLTLLQVL